MPKWKERECTTCHQVLMTASQSSVCISCFTKNKKGTQDKIVINLVAGTP